MNNVKIATGGQHTHSRENGYIPMSIESPVPGIAVLVITFVDLMPSIRGALV